MPYHAKKQVETRLRLTEYGYNRLSRFRNKLFVKNGLDEVTGAYPIVFYLSAFIAHARSVMQCICKEVTGTNKQKDYDAYVHDHAILGFFADVRNAQIHDYAPIVQPVLHLTSRITRFGRNEAPLDDNTLSSVDSSKKQSDEAKVTYYLRRRIEPTPELLDQLKAEGELSLVEVARRGEDLYEDWQFEGECDVHVLCEGYMKELREFVSHCVTECMIT